MFFLKKLYNIFVHYSTNVQKDKVGNMKLFFNKNKRLWHKYYNKKDREVTTPDMSLFEYLYNSNIDRLNKTAINYFGKRADLETHQRDYDIPIDIEENHINIFGEDELLELLNADE